MDKIRELRGVTLKCMLVVIAAMVIFPAVTSAAPPPGSTETPNTATPQDSVCQGIGLASGSDTCSDSGGGVSVDSAIATGLNILSWVVGIAAIIMIIIGGFKYITSSGDSGNITSAKNTILYAIIGLVIVALAQFIVQFVLNKAVVPANSAPKSSQHP